MGSLATYATRDARHRLSPVQSYTSMGIPIPHSGPLFPISYKPTRRVRTWETTRPKKTVWSLGTGQHTLSAARMEVRYVPEKNTRHPNPPPLH